MIRLGVRVAREQSELVLAELLALAPDGVEEVDLGPVVEYAVYGAPGELPALPDLEAVAGGAVVEIHSSQIADDWPQRWREFHKPLVIDSKLCVRPPWEPPAQAEIDVVIDPGQAFGTGAHPTTRLCLELMLEVQPGELFIDLGCGSGVLAIVATRLGWPQVLALDHDPTALAATEANARRNGVRVQTRRLDMRREQVPEGDLLAANVLAGPLGSWAASQRRMPPAVILSGVLREEVDAVRGRFAARGLHERERRVAGEWVALRCTVAP